MGTNSAGNVGTDNGGQTDQNRGDTVWGVYDKSQRQTGRTGSATIKNNSNALDEIKRTNNDPRTV